MLCSCHFANQDEEGKQSPGWLVQYQRTQLMSMGVGVEVEGLCVCVCFCCVQPKNKNHEMKLTCGSCNWFFSSWVHPVCGLQVQKNKTYGGRDTASHSVHRIKKICGGECKYQTSTSVGRPIFSSYSLKMLKECKLHAKCLNWKVTQYFDAHLQRNHTAHSAPRLTVFITKCLYLLPFEYLSHLHVDAFPDCVGQSRHGYINYMSLTKTVWLTLTNLRTLWSDGICLQSADISHHIHVVVKFN